MVPWRDAGRTDLSHMQPPSLLRCTMMHGPGEPMRWVVGDQLKAARSESAGGQAARGIPGIDPVLIVLL